MSIKQPRKSSLLQYQNPLFRNADFIYHPERVTRWDCRKEKFSKIKRKINPVWTNLTSYAPCIILQCVEEPTRCTSPAAEWLCNHAAAGLARKNVPTAWYSLIDSAPDDGRAVSPKHVQQAKSLEKVRLFVRICASCWFLYVPVCTVGLLIGFHWIIAQIFLWIN